MCETILMHVYLIADMNFHASSAATYRQGMTGLAVLFVEIKQLITCSNLETEQYILKIVLISFSSNSSHMQAKLSAQVIQFIPKFLVCAPVRYY